MVFGSLAVFLSLSSFRHAVKHTHTQKHTRGHVIFSKDSDFYASLAFSTLRVFCVGPRWGS